MTIGRMADLLIRADCVFEGRRSEGFVLRLGRSEALYTSREPVETGEVGRLALQLPWHLGALDLLIEVKPSDADGCQVPAVTLSFRGVPQSQLDRIEKYLTRYYYLLAQLEL